MPHDAKGNLLQVGDEVIIRAKVKDVQTSEEYCNVTLVTTAPMPPYAEGTTLTLNTKQVEKDAAAEEAPQAAAASE